MSAEVLKIMWKFILYGRPCRSDGAWYAEISEAIEIHVRRTQRPKTSQIFFPSVTYGYWNQNPHVFQ
jgi:hypothetical protein